MWPRHGMPRDTHLLVCWLKNVGVHEVQPRDLSIGKTTWQGRASQPIHICFFLCMVSNLYLSLIIIYVR
jgi:hypothetical protein